MLLFDSRTPDLSKFETPSVQTDPPRGGVSDYY